jgi:hypothetical protein
VILVDPDGEDVDVSLFDTKKTPKDGRIVNYGKKIPTVSNSFQVLAHGNSLYMRNVQNGEKVTGEAGQINSAERFDQAFSNNKEWQNGKNTKGFNVILYSCNTRRGQNSLASKISDAYENINVIAPTRQVHISNDGTTGVYGTNSDGSKNTTDPGYWIVYQKGVAVEAYDATWQPGGSTEGHRVDLKIIPESHYKGSTDSKNNLSIDKKTD